MLPERSNSAPTPRPTGRQHILRIEAVIRDETDDRSNSDFGLLRQEQRILHVDTKVSGRVLYLGVTEQYLDRTDITCRSVDHPPPISRSLAEVYALLTHSLFADLDEKGLGCRVAFQPARKD